MQYVGAELQQILERQHQEVAVYDSNSFTRGLVKSRQALQLVTNGLYVGIGNRNRIRAIRPLSTMMMIEQLHHASKTTRRPRNDLGQLFAGRRVVEHRKQS